nr:uncharacterized protein CI109_006952 [Kwoniella shandongensis]KAA5524694.1 hypothetical protein CI109_006952 [Kwoniella shandongensis]
MSNIIITGATGNAGSAVLTAAIASPSISKILVLSRREPFETSPKVTHIKIPSDEYPKGFDEFPPSLVERMKEYDAVVWALGISQMEVKKDEYINAAKAFRTLASPSHPFKFIYMSGEGARQDEKGWGLFSKIKGRAEKELYAMNKDGFEVVNIRPAGINPTPEHRARLQNRLEFARQGIFSVFNTVAPKYVIGASDLGKACVVLARGHGWEKRDGEGVIGNVELCKLAQAF